MLLNPSTTKYITPPVRDILQPPTITEMPRWNTTLVISLLIYLLSLTWKWNSNTVFQSSYFKITKKTTCNLGMRIVTFFLTSDFNSHVNHDAHIKAACWLMLQFYLYLFLATRRLCTEVILVYSEISIASNDSGDGLEANEALHALAFFQKFYVCNFFKSVSDTNMHFTTDGKR